MKEKTAAKSDAMVFLVPKGTNLPPTFNIPALDSNGDIFVKIVAAHDLSGPAYLELDDQELDFLLRNLDWLKFRPFVLNNIPDVELPISWHQVQTLLDSVDFDQVSEMLEIEMKTAKAKSDKADKSTERGAKPSFDEQEVDETPEFEPLD